MTSISKITNKKAVAYKQTQVKELDGLIKSWGEVKTSAIKTGVVKQYKEWQKELRNEIKKIKYE